MPTLRFDHVTKSASRVAHCRPALGRDLSPAVRSVSIVEAALSEEAGQVPFDLELQHGVSTPAALCQRRHGSRPGHVKRNFASNVCTKGFGSLQKRSRNVCMLCGGGGGLRYVMVQQNQFKLVLM